MSAIRKNGVWKVTINNKVGIHKDFSMAIQMATRIWI